MNRIKIVVIALGVLVIAAVFLGALGIPARGLIESYSRTAFAKNDLTLAIDGDARFSVWPGPNLTIAQARVQDAGEADLVTVERVRANFSWRDLVSGRVHITDLVLTGPVVNVDPILARAQRKPAQTEGGAAAPGGPAIPVVLPNTSALAIDAVRVENGKARIRDGRDSVDLVIDSLQFAMLPAASGHTDLRLDARLGPTALRLLATVDQPVRMGDGMAVPVAIAIDAPSALKSPAALTATVTKSGPVVKVDGLDAAIGQDRIRGSGSVSFAGPKPYIAAALESERIDLTGLIETIGNVRSLVRASGAQGSMGPAAANPPAGEKTAPADGSAAPGGSPPRRDAASGNESQARGSAAVPADRSAGAADGSSAAAAPKWSDAPLNLFGLRLCEANIGLAAREVLVEGVRIAPATLEAALRHDVLTVNLPSAGVYGGQASGEFVVDRTHDDPSLSVRLAFSDIDALPLFTDAFDFRSIAGRLRGAVDVKGAGASPLRIVAGLNGEADLQFEDGALRGLDLPAMVRSLVDRIVAGWHANASEETRFRTFSARFVVDHGVARSTAVSLNGPFVAMTAAGSADLRNQTLDFRADPKLVSSADATPWSLGVPVVVQGPWSNPRIYADVPNVLANPDGALRALRDALGGGSGGGESTTAPLGKIIENLSKRLGRGTGDPVRDGNAIAEEVLKALGKTRGSDAPPAETIAPDADAPADPAAQPPTTPAPERNLGRGARELLRDLLGR